MRYIKIFEEHVDMLKAFKNKIDWKLINYIQTILTEYWDIPVKTLYLHVRIDDYTIWYNDFEEENLYQNWGEDQLGKLYGKINNLGFKLKYVIGFADDREQQTNEREIIKEIISKLKNRYIINYEEDFLCISFYEDDYKLK